MVRAVPLSRLGLIFLVHTMLAVILHAGPPPPPCSTTPAPSPQYLRIQLIGKESGCTEAANSCLAGEEVRFEVTGTDFSECPYVAYFWDFGDGSTSVVRDKTTTHNFAVAGLHEVTCIVSVTNKTATISQQVVISALVPTLSVVGMALVAAALVLIGATLVRNAG